MRASKAGWIVAAVCSLAAAFAGTADRYDAAVAHPGRPEADRKRDLSDHPAELLRLAGIRPGMRVADVMAGSGYFSELASYVVGPSGRVLLINNAAYDRWSDGLESRLADHRLPNVEHDTVDLNHMQLPAASLDAVLLIKVYHDLYWVDSKGEWPAIDAGRVIEQLVTAMKPGAVLLLVDHSAKSGAGSADASELHRIEESYAIRDFERHGLQVAARSDLFRRPDDARDQVTYHGAMLGKTDRFILVFRKPGRASIGSTTRN